MKHIQILNKVLNYINSIETYTSDTNYALFLENKMMIDACVFNLSQIGELVNKLDKEFLEHYNYIAWHQIRGLRNKIVHDYDGINFCLIWQIVADDLPDLKKKINEIIIMEKTNK